MPEMADESHRGTVACAGPKSMVSYGKNTVGVGSMKRPIALALALFALVCSVSVCAAEAAVPADPEGTLAFELDGIAAKAIPTKDDTYCVFITNNADKVIDELNVTICYLSADGQIVDSQSDGHDMILPGFTVVSKLSMARKYASAKLEFGYEAGIHPHFENHVKDVAIASNFGSDNLIIQITNNSEVEIAEIEYAVVYYLYDEILEIEDAKVICDVAAGDTVIEEANMPRKWNSYRIYLNHALTFGLE